MPKNSYIQALEYAITNILTFGLDIFLIWLMVNFWGFNYFWAVVFGYIIAIVLTYFVNRDWVYRGTHMKITEGFLRTFAVAVFCFLLVLVLMLLFVELFKMDYIVARLWTGLLSGLIGYVLDTVFAFRMPLLYKHRRKKS